MKCKFTQDLTYQNATFKRLFTTTEVNLSS